MSRDRVNAICARFAGAECNDPWGGGHDAWNVGGKMFACIGAVTPGVSVKTPDIETAQLLIENGRAERAPYFHRSWVLVDWDIEGEELEHRLRTSYELIKSKLPKKVQAELVAH